jgi:lipid-A-disaccharide synthase
LKLFILAGEPSGDRLGADLVERLRERTELELVGVGGQDLIGQGLKTMFPMRELSVMGWRDIIPRLPWLHFRAWQVARKIVRTKPDVVVLVDAQIFSAVVAGHVRRMRSDVPIILYVAPAVWAWAPERAQKLIPLFNEVLSVLPFEPRVMRELGGPPTHYVGHPATKRLTFRTTAPERGPLLLLPGSREGELRRHLPLMRAVAEDLRSHPRVSSIVIPTLPFLAERLRRATEGWATPVEIVSNIAQRTHAYAEAIAACTSMGTATLELALAGVPMAGTYVGDKGQEQRFLKYKVKHVSLPNVLLGQPLVPEVLFVEPSVEPDKLSDAMRRVVDYGAADQLAGFRQIRATMEEGLPESPVVDPVERVLSYRRSIGS